MKTSQAPKLLTFCDVIKKFWLENEIVWICVLQIDVSIFIFRGYIPVNLIKKSWFIIAATFATLSTDTDISKPTLKTPNRAEKVLIPFNGGNRPSLSRP